MSQVICEVLHLPHPAVAQFGCGILRSAHCFIGKLENPAKREQFVDLGRHHHNWHSVARAQVDQHMTARSEDPEAQRTRLPRF